MLLQSPLAVVTPTLDGDVLTLLARVDAAMTVGQMRSLIPHRSDEGIRKAARRLADQGIVTTESLGSVAGYRLNRSHLAAPHVIALAGMYNSLLQRMAEHLERWPIPPVWAAIFGSAARGDMTESSDIDVFLVDPGTDAEGWDAATTAFAADVAAWTGNDLRILSLTEDEVRRGAALKDPIIESLLADAHTVTGRADWLRSAVRGALR